MTARRPTVTVVITVADENVTPTEVHEAIITAIDLSGFRDWASYVAKDGDPLPEPRIPPPELR